MAALPFLPLPAQSVTFNSQFETDNKTAMPYALVIILSPKVIYINHLDEVVVVTKPAQGQGLGLGDIMSSGSVDIITPVASETPSESSEQQHESSSTANHELIEINLRQLVSEVLEALYNEQLLFTRPTVVEDDQTNSIQAMCLTDSQSIDRIVNHLSNCGVGTVAGSVNVIDLETSKFCLPNREREVSSKHSDQMAPELPEGRGRSGTVTSQVPKEDDSNRLFKVSMLTSQIRVEQMIEQIEAAATMNFDYIMLLLIASTIAAVGLATNNTVAIVASMLVSPIMGPVMALTFGATVHDWSLCKLGLLSELLSLAICVAVGFAVGLVTISVGTGGHWPTDEMKSRGIAEGLPIGLGIAIPSGMGVALSILGNNTSSLVGVAISASLLPPAVNLGIALAYAAIGFHSDPDAIDDMQSSYTDSRSYADLGGISLALTAVNIGAIFISAWAIFKIKEVAPLKNKTLLWQQGIQAFRQFTTTAEPPSPEGDGHFAQQMAASYAAAAADDIESQLPSTKPRPKSLSAIELLNSSEMFQSPSRASPNKRHHLRTQDDALLGGSHHQSPLPLSNLLSGSVFTPSKSHRYSQQNMYDRLHDILQHEHDKKEEKEQEQQHHRLRPRASVERAVNTATGRDTVRMHVLPSSAEDELTSIKSKLRKTGKTVPFGRER